MNTTELSPSDTLWESLKRIPVTEEDGDVVIGEPFLHFPAGTLLTSVWMWFEARNSAFSVAHKLYGNRSKTSSTFYHP